MDMRFLLVFISFFLSTGFIGKSGPNLMADNSSIDQKSMDEFKNLSRQSGGTIILLDKKDLKKNDGKMVDFIEDDLYGGPDSIIFTLTKKLPGGISQWNFFIDSTIKKLQITVDTSLKKPSVSIFDPAKNEVHGKEIFPGKNGTRQIFENLLPGSWSLRVEGDEEINLIIRGVGLDFLSNSNPEIVSLKMGHEGPSYFPEESKANLTPGDRKKLSLEIDFGKTKFTKLNLQLISLSGAVLDEINLGSWDGIEGIIDFLVPKESFRLMLVGVNSQNGEYFQRMWKNIFIVK